jgi:hypothetical membrane protein
VRGNRLRWGALGWVLTLQFFVVEAIAALQWAGYSYADNTISDLGTASSPAHRLMNASFVVQAALILAGVVLLLPAVRGRAARVAQVVLALAAVGVLLVGLFPVDRSTVMHDIGALLYLAGGAVGLLALAYAMRPRSELLGTALAILGLAGAATTIFFATGVTEYLGRGGTERVAGYVLPIGLTVAAVAVWRMARGGATLPETPAGPSRRELRAEERAERAERTRERDEALEAAARRREQPTVEPAGSDEPAEDLDSDDLDPDDLDPEDPWATPTRRGDRRGVRGGRPADE